MVKVIISLCFLIMLSGCTGSAPDSDKALVKFSGGVLTPEDVAAHLQGLKRSSRFKDKPEVLTPEFAFEHALNMEMIIAKGLEEKLHLDPRIRNELHAYMSDLFLKVMQESMITPIDRESISEEDMLAFYEENVEQYTQKARYTLRAFSVDPEQAIEAVEKIKRQELNFQSAASSYALEKKEQDNGGHTGTRTLRRFRPSWRPVVESLEVGAVTGPTKIDDKTYVLLLEGKTEPYQHSFEEKKAYIKNDVLYSRYQDQWQKIYDDLRVRYKVEINKKKLEEFYRKTAETSEGSGKLTALAANRLQQ